MTASAALIPSLDSGPLDVAAGEYAYNYSVEITGGERLDPAATDGVTCPSNTGALVQCNPAGTFFTVYDFAGFVSVTGLPAGWSYITSLLGVTPSAVTQQVVDNPSIVNVTFYYTGSVVNGDQTMTGFQLVSSLNQLSTTGSFSSQSTKSDTGTADQLVGSLVVPSLVAIPEPVTIAFIGIGLVGLFALRKRS